LGGLERSIAEAAAGDADASRLTSVALRFARGFFATGFFGDVMVAVSLVLDRDVVAFTCFENGCACFSNILTYISHVYSNTLHNQEPASSFLSLEANIHCANLFNIQSKGRMSLSTCLAEYFAHSCIDLHHKILPTMNKNTCICVEHKQWCSD
jgi:hypothetical protein